MRYVVFIALICCLLPGRLFCQTEPYFQVVTKEDGLPCHTIYSLEEDGYGRILLGTEKGIFRYNGIHFKELVCKENSSKSIANIRKIDRFTFVGHNFNGQVFLLRNDQLSLLRLPQLPAEINNIRIKGDSLLVISLRKIYLYNWKKQRLIRIQESKSKEAHIFTAQFTRNGIAIGYTDGTIFDGKKNHQLQNKICYDIEEFNSKLLLTPIYGKNNNPLYLERGNIHELCRLRFSDNPKLYSTTLIGDRYYLCTQSGVVQIQSGTNKNNHWFKGYQVTKILKDHKGNFWLSTLNKGLLFIPNIQAVKLSSEPVVSINISGNSVFVGNAFGDVMELTLSGSFVRNYHPVLSLTEASFIEIEKDVIRTATSVFDRNTGKQLNTQFEYVKHYTRDHNGDFLFAKTYGLIKVSKGWLTKKGSEYGYSTAAHLQYLKNIRTKDVIVSDDNTIIAACIDGVYFWKYGKEQKLLFNGKTIKASQLYFYGNKLYISTNEFGVLVYEDFQLKEQIQTYKGLELGKVLKTFADENGVYILTDSDFFYQKTSGKPCRPMKQEMGLKRVEINDFALRSMVCFFATDVGIIKVPLLVAKPEEPNVVVNQIEINGRVFSHRKSFEVVNGENDLKLAIEPILFKNANSTEIAYQLNSDGTSGKWITIPISSKYLYLSSLRSGDYSLFIRISDSSSLHSKVIRRFYFTIHKPWYLQWQAFVIYAIIFAAFISFFWWLRAKFLRKKYLKDLEQQQLASDLAEARLTALRAQMNPHFMYNVLNSIQSLVYSDKHNEASKYLGKFANLTRLFLELSSKESISLKQECETLQIYLELEKMRFGSEFEYQISISPEIDTSFTKIPTLIIQPFVENSLKHGLLHKSGKKNLLIQFTMEEEDLRVVIRDNGIGRAKSAQINSRNKEKKTSYATAAVYKKLELLNKQRVSRIALTVVDLTGEYGNPEGTEIHIIIPQTL